MLRDAAMTWVRANCPNTRLRADVERQLDEALRDGVDCWFVVGREMTRKRVPELVHCFAGELFVFQLTDSQFSSIGTRPNGLGYSRDPQPLSDTPPTPPIVHISRFELDPPRFTAESEITGWCDYEVTAELPMAICLRLDYSLGKLGNLLSYDYPDQLPSRAGRFQLRFKPMADAAPPRARAYKGPVVMFVRACVPTRGEAPRQIISNACGTLVEFF